MQCYYKQFGLFFLLSLSTSILTHQEQERFSFWHGILRNPAQVGAIAPCSSRVAQEISKHINTAINNRTDTKQPMHILEVGGGCGALTEEIEKKLNETGEMYLLDVLEIDAHYCTILQEKFKHNPRVQIRCVDATTWSPSYCYDVIISSLPFTSLPNEVVMAMVNQFKNLVKKGGFISYLEYILLARLKKAFLLGEKKKEFEEKISVLSDFKKDFGIETTKIWLNIMPANIHHLMVC